MRISPSLLAFALTLPAAALVAQDRPAAASPPATASPPAAATDQQTRLLRFPATNGKQIVFSYAGQLYTVGMDGGTARRLTSGPGYSIFPRFSPDGTLLAYTGQYDGNTEVFVMPAEGGEPKRLTWTATLGRDDVSDRMGPNNLVMGWKNKTNEVVFRSRNRTFNDFNGQLYSVGLDGGEIKPLPVVRGGFASFSPDDSRMAYNRVFREFRTWKRYRGGMADDVWVHDFKTGTTEKVTDDPAQDIIPMWGPDDTIYFVSERDGRGNLWSTDLRTKQATQLTTFKDFDVKWPSIGKSGIVFEQAGYIWHLDFASKKAKQLNIVIREDLSSGRTGIVDAAKFINTVNLAPDAKRVVVSARGELFSVPAKDGTPRSLTGSSSGAHERDGVWSPDGKWIAYVSDESGETEIWIRPQDGKGAPQKLTSGADTYYYHPEWSPDSKKLAWSDRLQRLRFVDVESKAVTEVDQSKAFEIRQFAWSPDSKWIAYARPDEEMMQKIWLYSLEGKKKIEATEGWYASDDPSFSDDGKYLLFGSSRDFRPLYGNLEFNHVYRDMERPYFLALAKDTPSPVKPRSDEVEIAGEKKPDAPGTTPTPSPSPTGSPAAAAGPDAAKDAPKKPVVVKVDEEGLKDRIAALPVPSGNYQSIRMVGDKVYYLRAAGPDDPEAEGFPRPRRALYVWSMKDRKETELGRFEAYDISANGKRMLLKEKKDYNLIDLPSAKIDLKPENKLAIAGLDVRVDHRAEWKQIYNECWRQMRDFFYDPGMHGVDWKAMREKYAALLPWVNHRNDLTYLVAELISELNVGHAYVGGGERPDVPRLRMGLLGAEYERDPATKAYKITRILRGENWNERTRAPLTEIGLNVKEGDYILAVNGRPVSQLVNLQEALIGTVGKQVSLRVSSKPTDDASARDIVVVPTGDEGPLYYYAWVQRNIDYVSKKTGGKVGYLHIPDMGVPGLNEFAKLYYPQTRKKALIVDVRGNGGGNVSPQIIERLRRELVMVNIARNSIPNTNPGAMIYGPLVTLMDEFSASDGDIFPYRFKTLKMGKLIGKRSWGGVVGIRNALPLADGGTLNRPEFAPYAKDGKSWVIEGHGVDPDIVVDNEPAKEFKGEDQQLDRAIAEILKDLEANPKDLPPVPPYPKKDK